MKAFEFLVELIAYPSLPFAGEVMIVPAGLPRAKRDRITVCLGHSDDLSSLQRRHAQGIHDMRFWQPQVLTIGRCFVAKHRGERSLPAERGIQRVLALHCSLGDYIQMPTDSYGLEGELPLVEFVMACFAQGQQIRERIFSAVLPEENVMGFQSTPFLAALLALVPVAHQTGQAHILIQSSRILILTSLQIRIVETRDVHLHILYDDRGNGQ